jgi:hypothetical protein
MRLIRPLPDPFLTDDGRVSTRAEWSRHRESIRATMLDVQYGTMPGAPARVAVAVGEPTATSAGHTEQVVSFVFTPRGDRPDVSFGMDAIVRRPSASAVTARRGVISGFGDDGLPTVVYVGGGNFPLLLDAGYMIVSFENNQIEPMEMGKPMVGIAREAYEMVDPGAYSWGSISAWAWGALRLVDYAVTLDEVDASRLLISGHSRNGKTALLAGALDDRVALVNPAGSGCAGAGSYLALDDGCEDLAALTSRERWWAWTRADFEHWVGRETDLPFDQHFLMGLVAPRPLLRTEGSGDEWANPAGTCAAFLATQPVYDFLGVPDANGIHVRDGGHHQGDEDVDALREFADWHLYGVAPSRDFHAVPYDDGSFDACFSWSAPNQHPDDKV